MIELEGRSIGGKAALVRLSAVPGPVRIGAEGVEVGVRAARVVSGFRTTTVELGASGPRVASVEHLYAALAGLGVRTGVAMEVEGGALPLLDGGAARFTEALLSLGLPRGGPSLRVVRAATIEAGGALATFEPGEQIVVRARVVGLGRALDAEATWSGDADDFCTRIAPARTFLVADDADAMLAAGLSAVVAPESVVVVERGGGAYGTGTVAPDEPARHKLLDLLGDLYAWGGPPVGRVLVQRPGHGTNHVILERALSEGILARR